MELTFDGKSNKRQQRRIAEKRRTERLKKQYHARTKGAYLDDNGDLDEARLSATIYKRHDREQKGRLRILKGCCPSGVKKNILAAIADAEVA